MAASTLPLRAFRVAYDGRGYRGFQRQPDVPTVSDAIRDALWDLDIGTEELAQYRAAGRTDAGVSALAQTISCRLPAWVTPGAINSNLPDDIRVWAAATPTPPFHATHDATSRTYEYYLYRTAELAVDRVRTALNRLAGTHDFHNLTTDDTHTERDLSTAIRVTDTFLVVSFHADGFPRQFVRRAVSLLRRVGSGQRSAAFVDRVLDPTPLPGPEGIPPAAPQPLVLVDVTYPECTFTVAEAAARRARSWFQSQHREHSANAQVSNRIADGIAPGDRQSHQ